MFSIQQALLDGLIYSTVISIVVIGSLYYNPRIWLHDYPKAIQAVVPPMTREETRLKWLFSTVMMALVVGIPLYATYSLKIAAGGVLSFGEAYVNAFVMTNSFNIVDAVILDLLLLTFMKPKFAVLPGAEGMEYLYRDWGMQLRNFLKGCLFCVVFSAIIALIVMVV